VGGRPWHGGLGLRALPAVLQADGELPGRGGHAGRGLPRVFRAARSRARPGRQSAVSGLLYRGAAGRVPPHERRERVPAGGVRRLRQEHSPRPPAVRGARLPAPGHGPAEPAGRDPGAGRQDPLRRDARDRGGVRAARRDGGAWFPPPGTRRRGDRVRRGIRLAAVAAAFRGGQRHRTVRARHPGRGRPAGCRREHAGPPGGVHPVRVQAAGVGGTRAQVAQPAPGRSGSPCCWCRC
jgi:hypothetical protein